MQGQSARAIRAACGCAAQPDRLVSLTLKIRRLARNSRLVAAVAVTSLGNPSALPTASQPRQEGIRTSTAFLPPPPSASPWARPPMRPNCPTRLKTRLWRPRAVRSRLCPASPPARAAKSRPFPSGFERKIIEVLRSSPGMETAEVAKATNAKLTITIERLRRLRAKGLIEQADGEWQTAPA